MLTLLSYTLDIIVYPSKVRLDKILIIRRANTYFDVNTIDIILILSPDAYNVCLSDINIPQWR